MDVSGARKTCFGGKGLLTVVTGPGRILLHTMPLSGLIGTAARLARAEQARAVSGDRKKQSPGT